MPSSILLVWERNLLYVKPWVPWLESALVCHRKEFDPFSQKQGVVDHPMFEVETSKTGAQMGVVRGGLFHKVQWLLKSMGYVVEVNNQQRPPPDPVIPENVHLREGQAEILATLTSAWRGGLIEGPPAMGKTFLITLLPQIYPNLHILISTMRSALLNSIHSRMQKANPTEKIGLISKGRMTETDARIQVCSAMSLRHVPDEWPDLVLFDECHNAASKTVWQDVCRFDRARVFGLSATPFGRGDGADLITEAVFGPIIHRVAYQQAVHQGNVSPIEVWTFPVQCPGSWHRSLIKRKRTAIWENEERNQLIGSIAHALPDDTKVLVLVQSIEHACILHRCMPDYHLVYSGLTESRRTVLAEQELIAPDAPLELNMGAWITAFEKGQIKKVIATMAWREGLDIVDLCFLIRADGQSGPIPSVQIGGRLSRVQEGKPTAVLIDFTDIGLERATYTRHSHYEKQGWTVRMMNLEVLPSWITHMLKP